MRTRFEPGRKRVGRMATGVRPAGVFARRWSAGHWGPWWALAVLLGCSATPLAPPERTPVHPLVGSWRLLRYENLSPDGRIERPFGARPRGLFIYDQWGNVAIQISTDEGPRCSVRAGTCQADDLAALVRGYSAYFGRYRVQHEQGTVVHEIEASLLPEFLGTAHPRPFRLEGDRLLIGDGRTWVRELERVR
jgi:hypothetical protein